MNIKIALGFPHPKYPLTSYERKLEDYDQTMGRHGIDVVLMVDKMGYDIPLAALICMSDRYADAMSGTCLPSDPDPHDITHVMTEVEWELRYKAKQVEAALTCAGFRESNAADEDGWSQDNLHLVSVYGLAEYGIDSLTGIIYDLSGEGKAIGRMESPIDVASIILHCKKD